MENQTQVATTSEQTERKMPIAIGSNGIQLRTMDDLWRFSLCVQKSGLAPKGLQTTEAIFIAIQMGLEIGLTPMAALQNIAVINGHPGIYGDAALGLVRANSVCKSYSQEYHGQWGTDDFKAVVTSLRVGDSKPIVSEFSVADAKQAKLWQKQGPWTEYPKRMLLWRARGFNLRDNFGDVLKGLRTTDELRDMPAVDVESERVVDSPKFTPKAIELPKTEASPLKPATAAETVYPSVELSLTADSIANATAKRGPGRPPGSKNKEKTIVEKISERMSLAGITFAEFLMALVRGGQVEEAQAGEIPDLGFMPANLLSTLDNDAVFTALVQDVESNRSKEPSSE